MPIALLAAMVQPDDFRYEREDALLVFSYGWPRAVEEEPALRATLAREMEAAEATARATAREDRDRRAGNDLPFNGHYHSKI